ncbi:MAG TPA: N-6 DNA methylase [Myxococcaceae bacterium]|nr:N-6 DNA methylase [Myxococcaceae bacterium]
MEALERDNPSLRGALPRDYSRQTLDARKLGELVELVGSLGLEQESQGKDILGRVYEYFLAKFARAEGKNGGQFYTPRCLAGDAAPGARAGAAPGRGAPAGAAHPREPAGVD